MSVYKFDVRRGIVGMNYLLEQTNEGRIGSDFKVANDYNLNFFKNAIEFLKLRVIKYEEEKLFRYDDDKIIYTNEKDNINIAISFLKNENIYKISFHKNKREIPDWETQDVNKYIFVIFGNNDANIKYKELLDALKYS